MNISLKSNGELSPYRDKELGLYDEFLNCIFLEVDLFHIFLLGLGPSILIQRCTIYYKQVQIKIKNISRHKIRFPAYLLHCPSRYVHFR